LTATLQELDEQIAAHEQRMRARREREVLEEAEARQLAEAEAQSPTVRRHLPIKELYLPTHAQGAPRRRR
jgi:hypothetical protein